MPEQALLSRKPVLTLKTSVTASQANKCVVAFLICARHRRYEDCQYSSSEWATIRAPTGILAGSYKISWRN